MKDNKLQNYAHSLSGQPSSKWQPLEEHLENVARKAKEFATPFLSDAWASNAAFLHDLGKADSAFQGYLRRCNGLDDAGYDAGIVNHSSAGAAFAREKLALPGTILAYLIAGHHAGLPDWYPANAGRAALEIRLEEGRENLKRIETFAQKISCRLDLLKRPPDYVKPANFHFWVRMLFSCLVDADYMDTEQFMEQSKAKERGQFPTLENLAEFFFPALDKIEQDAVKSSVNKIRSDIRRICEQKAKSPQGIFSLTVPTGGGKTLSAMAFALRHALERNQKQNSSGEHVRRVIYVIPYTSIIEQTSRILAGILGRENVVEHHSNLNSDKETLRSQLASENWDAPIIVTTNVQFFESLYAAKPNRCRKLHNIINSVVILDEAQLLPPELLTPCVDAINDLVRNYGVTLLLATATQPALPRLDSPVEIIPQQMNLYDRLKRTEITFPESLQNSTDWFSLAQQLQEYAQVLCVVNTRRDCHDLFKLMPKGTIHLSALMCAAHRVAVIRLIRRRLSKGMPIRVISTQLIEAGVDIDFPVVYRALAGLDSIAQAAGRCNREGKLNDFGQVGQVCVFVPPKSAPRGLLLKGENTTRELCSLPEFDLQNPKIFSRYFQSFYSRVNDMGSQFYDLLVKDVNPTLHFQFRTAAKEFKLIKDEHQRTVIVRYGRNQKLLNTLRVVGPTRQVMRQLQRYCVHLPIRLVEKMKLDGMIEELPCGILVQTYSALYKKDIGLDVFSENLPVEDLIFDNPNQNDAG